jgi:hypothetical protein
MAEINQIYLIIIITELHQALLFLQIVGIILFEQLIELLGKYMLMET